MEAGNGAQNDGLVKAAKLSAVENVKEASHFLRGTINDSLETGQDHFSDADKNLLKFHGSYQQENRDARKTRTKDGPAKEYQFMVRCKIPGGRLSANQYLEVDDLAGKYANGTLRFTTRQGIQLHGVLKGNLKATIAGINSCLLTTLGACGDVNRNVMACPAPHLGSGVRGQLQEAARKLAAHFAPRTLAYHEIWLNGKEIKSTGARPAPEPVETEPIYGTVYLPRKFKMGLALPEDNCIDVLAQDLGFLAIVENDAVVGFECLVGGGMGMTHGNAVTFPHLARPILYASADRLIEITEAVVKLFRDHGNRQDRKRARIKYLVHDWGVARFQEVLKSYLKGPLEPARMTPVTGYDPHLGWRPQGNGSWYYGISVENGRVKDEGTLRLRTALRTLASRFRTELRITPLQDILICNLPPHARPEIEAVLTDHGVTLPENLSTVRRNSLACPALPTCGLALTESERIMPDIVVEFENLLCLLGLEKEIITLRMTGCPNGCARPYQSDIGLVGRSGDKYTIFVGGDILGNRLNFPLKDLVPRDQIVSTLRPLLETYSRDREPGEGFGTFCHRLGLESLIRIIENFSGRLKFQVS